MNNESCIEECRLIILGLADAGKTSIREVIFEGKNPTPSNKEPKEHKISSKMIELAGKRIEIINARTIVTDDLFEDYETEIYSNVKAAVFVIDISDAANILQSKRVYDLTLEFFKQHNPEGLIYIFAHKTDLVTQDELKTIIETIKDQYQIKDGLNVEIFGTSIYNETIWLAMQKVISTIYPREEAKSETIKKLVEDYKLTFLTLSTSRGIILYSSPNIDRGFNYRKIKKEIVRALFPGFTYEFIILPYEKNTIFIKEIDENLILTIAFPDYRRHSTAKRYFREVSEKILNFFESDEMIEEIKEETISNLITFLKSKGFENIKELTSQFDQKCEVSCDVCGKQIKKSILDVALEYPEQLQKGIKVSMGFGDVSVEIYPTHECQDGPREIPILLDGNLEYRRYDDSRPI
ncbi:MAG: hypothetical protein GF308_21715 [Candidatus Heimdallarchaeota archaeon]|nr:hypothetical protein [Candidatus Heimdallarchaeota archaeon]